MEEVTENLTYRPRIVADPTYVQALGQAFNNDTYLEWVVIWTIVRLSSDGFDSVPKGKHATGGVIARALEKAIESTTPPLEDGLRRRLLTFYEAFDDALDSRNNLLHAHPFTAPDGAQQLLGSGHLEWPIETVHEAAKLFEEAAIMGNDIFYGDLAKARP